MSGILSVPLAIAGPRSSANYRVDAETIESGGLRATSAHYGQSGSLGGIAGIASVVAPAAISKSGYLGQITDEVGFQIMPAGGAANVNEGGSLQFFAFRVSDDATFLSVNPGDVNWIATGLLSANASGLLTAGHVYQDTPATLEAAHLGDSTTFNLTVRNVGLDDFGIYAGDSLDDQWQVQYFGLDSPNASPTLDPDGDGQSNAFEFAAGVAPNDPASAFQLRIQAVAEQPGQQNIVFSPRFTGRTYALEFETDLARGAWLPLTGAAQADNGLERTVTDADASGEMKYYRVRISNP